MGVGRPQTGVQNPDRTGEVRAPLSPHAVVARFVAILKTYGIRTVTGDRYAGEWPREAFREHGISYRPSASVVAAATPSTSTRTPAKTLPVPFSRAMPMIGFDGPAECSKAA